MARLELARDYSQRSLSPLRLPIPPHPCARHARSVPDTPCAYWLRAKAFLIQPGTRAIFYGWGEWIRTTDTGVKVLCLSHLATPQFGDACGIRTHETAAVKGQCVKPLHQCAVLYGGQGGNRTPGVSYVPDLQSGVLAI